MTKDDDFFIDSDGYVVVEDPQHGQACRLHKATEEEKMVYLEKLLESGPPLRPEDF